LKNTIVAEIILKAVNDHGFHQQLYTIPETALAGYDLIAQERDNFNNITVSGVVTHPAKPEPYMRLSSYKEFQVSIIDRFLEGYLIR
jgi:hypothetical protein